METRLSKSKSRSRAARLAARRCRRARRPASARRSSCATATRSATSAKACCKAVANVNGEIAKAVTGGELDQRSLDQTMIDLDGTPTKSRLGANAHPRRVDGRRARRGSRGEEAALRAPRRRQRRAPAAGADDEHPQRRRARRLERRRAGVHGDAGRRADVRRSAADRRGDFSLAARLAEEARPRPPASATKAALRRA